MEDFEKKNQKKNGLDIKNTIDKVLIPAINYLYSSFCFFICRIQKA